MNWEELEQMVQINTVKDIRDLTQRVKLLEEKLKDIDPTPKQEIPFAVDAIGNPIVVGKYYAYSQSKNGINDVRIGKVTYISPQKRVRLEIVTSYHYVGDNQTQTKDRTETNVRSYISNRLFPVSKKQIKKLLSENKSRK